MALALPTNIVQFIGGAALQRDEVGLSPCQVYHFMRGQQRFFLKTSPAIFAPTTYSVLREASVLDWLAAYIKVPELVLTAQDEAAEYMITRAVPGQPLSACIAAGQPVLAPFQEALRQLQAVPVAGCPFEAGAALRLRELAYLLEHQLIDEEYDLSPWPELRTPQDLLARLQAHIPSEDLVFSHGDLCDNNVFIDGRAQLYFLDLGRGGLADRWLDIAFIHRNLRDEVSEDEASDFLAQLGLPDEAGKRAFFEQLDELF